MYCLPLNTEAFINFMRAVIKLTFDSQKNIKQVLYSSALQNILTVSSRYVRTAA